VFEKIALKENRNAIFNVLPHAFLRRRGGSPFNLLPRFAGED